MNALLDFTGAQGLVTLLLGAAGWLAALVALGLALSPRGTRWALLVAGLVAGLGATAALWGQRCEVGSLSVAFQSAPHAPAGERLVPLLGSVREARASSLLGTLAGGPLLVAAAGLAGLVLVRQGARP
jgi:hypothetical protein